MMIFHSVVRQLSLASRQVALKLGRNRSGPEVNVALKRALTESFFMEPDAMGLKMRALMENAVFNASGHFAETVCDAQSQFSAMPLLKLSPCGMLSPWRYAVVFHEIQFLLLCSWTLTSGRSCPNWYHAEICPRVVRACSASAVASGNFQNVALSSFSRLGLKLTCALNVLLESMNAPSLNLLMG